MLDKKARGVAQQLALSLVESSRPAAITTTVPLCLTQPPTASLGAGGAACSWVGRLQSVGHHKGMQHPYLLTD